MTTATTATIDGYLAGLARRLTLDPRARAEALEEVRAHLEEAAGHHIEAGADPQTAEAQAIAAFGAPAALAARLNAVHPIHWDGRRLAAGTAWAIAIIWAFWTLVTYPALVQMTADQARRYGAAFGGPLATPWGLVFEATPLSFGLLRVVTESGPSGLVVLVAFLIVFGAVPFVWGRRAASGWRAGLAFGLGVVIGLPWLPLALVLRWNAGTYGSLLISVLAVWMLLPYAVAAGWLGERSARVGWPGAWPAARRAAASATAAPMRPQRRAVLGRALLTSALLLLLGVSAWSWTRSIQPVPSVSAQLRTAATAVNFAIRQPSYLPAGMTLSGVVAAQAACGHCAVSLTYSESGGAQLILDENPMDPAAPPLPAPPNYQVSEGAVGSVNPIWWLADATSTEHQVNLTWASDGFDYFLGSNGAFTVPELERVAGSV